MLSSNGQYRIPSTGPDPNPFVSIAAARPEIYAYGFRNPHRLGSANQHTDCRGSRPFFLGGSRHHYQRFQLRMGGTRGP
jgi:hypothetical protein